MAARTVKVAISLPKEEFDAVERLRRELGLSRSALIARALRAWLKERSETQQVRRYLEGYRRNPESEKEIAEAASLALHTLETQEREWDEEE